MFLRDIFTIIFTVICAITLKDANAVKLPSWLGANRMVTGEPPSPRTVGHGMAALKDRFYVFGGFGPSGNAVQCRNVGVLWVLAQ